MFGLFAETRDDAHEFVARRGHRGGEQARRAVLRVLAGNGVRRVAAFHDVAAAAAVNVQIDKARQDVGRVVGERIGDMSFERRHAAVLEADRAVDPAIGREYVSFQHEFLWKYAMHG